MANRVKWSRVGSQLLETTPVLLKRNPGLFSKYFKLTDNPVGRKKSLIVRNTWKHSVDEQLAGGYFCVFFFLSTPGQPHFSYHLHYKAVEYKAHDSLWV